MKTKSSAFDFDFDWRLWVCQNFEQSKDNRYEKEVNTHTGRKALKRSSSGQKKKQGAPPESEKKGLFTQKSIRIFLEKKEIPELDPIGKRKRKLSKENSPDRESAPTKKIPIRK